MHSVARQTLQHETNCKILLVCFFVGHQMACGLVTIVIQELSE